MGSPTGYLVTSFGDMITCEPRMTAYAEALRQAIFPGCTVIDLGAGFGIFSLLACKYGARSVIAIEPNDIIELLGPAAAANGCADRIRIVRGLSTDFDDPIRADVIISDLRGCLPFFEGHIPAIADARERLLAPGGKLIPARDQLGIAIAEHAEHYRPHEEPWLRNKFDLDLTPGHQLAVNQARKVNLTSDQVLSAPQMLAELDYSVIRDPNLAVRTTLVADRPGMAHGLAIWFDAELAPGIGFSNAPGEPEQIYGQTFFPLERPVALAKDDRIEVEIRADLIDGSYVWSWNSQIWRKSAQAAELGFRQSSFLGRILSPRKLARRARDYVPPAQIGHAVDSYCLNLFDGRHSLGEIAGRLQARFPERFETVGQALNHVTALAERYQPASGGTHEPEPARPAPEDETHDG